MRWVGEGGQAGRANLDVVRFPTVVVDLDGAAGVDAASAEPWVQAVADGGSLVIAIGPGSSWRGVLDALVGSGRRWHVAEAVVRGELVHVAVRLDQPDQPDGGPAATFRTFAEAVAQVSEWARAADARWSATAATGASDLADLASTEDDGATLARDLDRARADLDRTRVQLLKERAILHQFRASIFGQVVIKYLGVRRRLAERWRARA